MFDNMERCIDLEEFIVPGQIPSNRPDIVDQLMKDEYGKPHLRITQRLRLDQPKLEDVQKRISTSSSHAIFLGLAGSTASIQLDEANAQNPEATGT